MEYLPCALLFIYLLFHLTKSLKRSYTIVISLSQLKKLRFSKHNFSMSQNGKLELIFHPDEHTAYYIILLSILTPSIVSDQQAETLNSYSIISPVHLFSYLFKIHLLNTYHRTDVVLGTEDIKLTRPSPCSQAFIVSG